MSTPRKTTASPRYVPVYQPALQLKPAELLAAFRVEPDNALWIGVNQVLRDMIANATNQVTDPAMASDPGAMAHTAGGLEWLRAFQAQVATLHEEAHRGELSINPE